MNTWRVKKRDNFQTTARKRDHTCTKKYKTRQTTAQIFSPFEKRRQGYLVSALEKIHLKLWLQGNDRVLSKYHIVCVILVKILHSETLITPDILPHYHLGVAAKSIGRLNNVGWSYSTFYLTFSVAPRKRNIFIRTKSCPAPGYIKTAGIHHKDRQHHKGKNGLELAHQALYVRVRRRADQASAQNRENMDAQ